MIKKIICPTDFSDRSLEAYNFASQIALAIPADLVLYHASVVPFDSLDELYFKDPKDFPESLQRENRKLIESWQALRNSGKENGKKVHFDFMLEQGFPLVSIVKAVNKMHADLVIMHTKSDQRSKFEGTYLGSVAAQVSEEVNTDVLLVPSGVTYASTRRFIYAIDIESWDSKSVQRAIDFSAVFNAEIIFFYLEFYKHNPKKEAFKQRFLSEFSGESIHFEIRKAASLVAGINDFLEEKKANMLVMERHKRHILQKLFGESVVHKMTHHAHIPLLIMHVED